jgi:hypothetical protein
MDILKKLWIVLAVILICYSTKPVLAWGPVGHQTIALIAEKKLDPLTKKAVYAILGLNENKHLSDVATWADDIRNKQTAKWHFIDLDIRENVTTDSIPSYCARDACVVNQVKNEIERLKKALADKKYFKSHYTGVVKDIKYLVHFVGDLHQPLHCADDDDRGGNNKIVRLFKPDGSGKGNKMKLHQVWDRLIEFRVTENPQDLAAELSGEIEPNDIELWVRGSVDEWAIETYQIARDEAYAPFKKPGATAKVVPLDKNYYGLKRPIEDAQMEKAGIRLAYILNSIYGPQISLQGQDTRHR